MQQHPSVLYTPLEKSHSSDWMLFVRDKLFHMIFVQAKSGQLHWPEILTEVKKIPFDLQNAVCWEFNFTED